MIAASKGYTLEIMRLISNGAEIFSETDQGATPLVFAVSITIKELSKCL